MPCYLVSTIKLDFKAADKDILRRAAALAGLTFVHDALLKTASGRSIVLNGEEAECDQRDVELVNKLRVTYGQEVLKMASQAFGWQMRPVAPNKYKMSKGGGM